MEELEVIVVYPIAWNFGIEILGIEWGINDRVVYRFTNDTKIRKAIIHDKIKGACIRTKFGMVNLSECIKTSYPDY